MEKKYQVEKGRTVLSYLPEEEGKKYICCLVNGRLRELTYTFENSEEVSLDFMDIQNAQASKIYEASLRYVVALAVKTINPKWDVKFYYNISRSIFGKILYKGKPLHINSALVKQLKATVDTLVEKDLPLQRIRTAKEEALRIYRENHFSDKVKVLTYRSEDFVHLYECKTDKLDYFDYLYSFLVPSTGYLKSYKIRFYDPGFLLQYPRSECQGQIPEFVDETKFAVTLSATSKWAENNDLDTVSGINRFIKTYGEMELINLSEARINNMLADLGSQIVNSPEHIRMICIAGPSSSGKTSFANRLRFELMARGLRPIRISMDDFYFPRADLPKGTDIESIEAIDIPFFNECMMKLISGETVLMPYYDFKDGKRKFAKELTVDENQPIIIEGIHALNSRLNQDIPQAQKYKIYISPQPQVNIDNHTPLSMTDMRLLRRIARDARTRNSSAKETISMWPNVRHGEFAYIYPTQENADFVFDSFVPYEPCALRNIVLPQLNQIKPNDPEYPVSQRLKSFVKYFLPIGITDIPCNSLMREFVGGSSYKDAR